MQSNKTIKIFGFLSVILFTSDYLTSTNLFFNILSYTSFIVLSFVIFDFKKINNFSIYIFLLSNFILIICALFGGSDLLIIFKYILLISTLCMTFIKRKELNKGILKSLLLYPFLTLLILGLTQLLILLLAPNLILPIMLGHYRPIGLSVEPTFYSQQLIMLAILCDSFGLKIKKFNFLIIFITLLLIFSCATRSSIIIAFIFLLTKFGLSFKKFITIPIFTSIFIYLLNLESFQYYLGLIGLNQRFGSLTSISGEPRELALEYMILKINQLPILGYGFIDKIEPNSSLTVGSLYANTPIALIYSLGFLSIPIFIIILIIICNAINKSCKLPVISIILFSLVMPFAYTSFGFFSIIIATQPINDKKLQKNSYKI